MQWIWQDWFKLRARQERRPFINTPSAAFEEARYQAYKQRLMEELRVKMDWERHGISSKVGGALVEKTNP